MAPLRMPYAAAMSEQSFGDRLREALAFSGTSQRELAEVLSNAAGKPVQPSRVSEWVNEASVPTASTRRSIARALHVSLRWLTTGEGSKADLSEDDPRIYTSFATPASPEERADRRFDEVAGRLVDLERKIDALIEHAGIDVARLDDVATQPKGATALRRARQGVRKQRPEDPGQEQPTRRAH